jgi:hypothetical protein
MVNALGAVACRSCGRGEDFLSPGTAYTVLGFMAPAIMVGLALLTGVVLWFTGVIPWALQSTANGVASGMESVRIATLIFVKGICPLLFMVYCILPFTRPFFNTIVKSVVLGVGAGILGLGMLLFKLGRRK